MAEAVVSFVIERLGDLLINKVVFLRGVRGQVGRLQDELVRIRCFLKDADQKRDEDERIRNWVSEIRAAGYDAEDVVEIFISKIESIKEKSFLKRSVYFPMKMWYLNKVGKEMESIQLTISDIADSREKYGIKNLGEGTSRHAEELQQGLRRSSAFEEDRDIVGFDDKTKFLVAELLRDDRRRRVVSITGMGGVGKTTLARQVYNHDHVKTRFDCRAWVCVSLTYNLRDILRTIIMQVKSISKELLDMLEKMQVPDLEQMLYEDLQGKCYLVILDDIWQEEAWESLAKVFPDANRGSRLLLTSRNQSVPLHADPLITPYELNTLGQEESWELFLKKLFCYSPDGRFPSDLEDIGREIVRRCAGLPLAITIIGKLLLGKKRLRSEWQSVLDNIRTYLSRGYNSVSAILDLSYSDLPTNLKFCFLYFGFFPEDSEISARKLTQMWIAEGIIHKGEVKCPEEIAADYMEQLLNRNMVQVARITTDDRVKSCRTHDLLRDLAIRKAKDDDFLQIHGGRDCETSFKARYLAVHCHSEENPTFSANKMPHLRSLLFFRMGRHVELDRRSFTCFRLLRVLDLEGISIYILPKEIGEVSLLRYLGLRFTYVTELPRSLSRLQSLQTLDVLSFGRTVKIPNVIWKLENLRHLYVFAVSCDVPLKVEQMRSLRTLSRLNFDQVMGNNLKSLTSLRKLGIWVDSKSEIDKLCTCLNELGHVTSLCLYCDENSQFPPLDGLSSFIHLTELKLSGSLNVLPRHFPPNLYRLSLDSTELRDDPMPILEKLERLSFLKLKGAYSGRCITISENGFHQLKFLELRMLRMGEVKVEKGGLTDLRCLRIRDCGDLKMLPEQLIHMTALEKLELVNMSKTFISWLEGTDSYKVSRVPTVRIFNLVENMSFAMWKLQQNIRVGFTAYLAALRFTGIKPQG